MTKPPQPIGAFCESTRRWVLFDDWRCDVGHGKALDVLAGASSDGASIPRLLWPLVGPQYAPDTFPAAFCHDMLYMSQWCKREYADRLFYEHLRLTGVGIWKAAAMYAAVRAFGGIMWRSHDWAEVEQARQLIRMVDA